MSQLAQVSVTEAPIGAFAFSPNVNLAVTGIAATSSIGNPTIIPEGNFDVTGEEATTAIGSVEANSQFIAIVTGIGLVASLDEETKASGNIEFEDDASFLLTVTLNSANPGVSAGATAPVTQVSASTELGSVTVAGSSPVDVTGEAATGSVGDVTIELVLEFPVTGVSGTFALGSIDYQGDVSVAVTGLSMTGEVDSANVWGKIVPNQSPNWTEIAA